MELKKALGFLTALEANNSLEWMQAHRAQYLEAKNEFVLFLYGLIRAISDFDPAVAPLRAEELMFRLNRDTRFSKDKRPYNPAFRAHISPAGKQPFPAGYYVHVSPGASFLGGGVFASQFPEATSRVRDYLVTHAAAFESILAAESFAANFTIVGDKLKNVPQGYDKGHPLADYLKHKAWAVEYPLDDARLLEGDVGFIAQKFAQMKPLNDFLNAALAGFTMPQR